MKTIRFGPLVLRDLPMKVGKIAVMLPRASC